MALNLEALNLESLVRGSTIKPQVLERVTGARIGSEAYKLKCLATIQTIEHYFREHRSEVVACRIIRGVLHVLHHDEQADHCSRLQRSSARKMKRALKLGNGVDETQLTQDQRDRLERAISVQVRTLSSYSDARRRFSLPAPVADGEKTSLGESA